MRTLKIKEKIFTLCKCNSIENLSENVLTYLQYSKLVYCHKNFYVFSLNLDNTIFVVFYL